MWRQSSILCEFGLLFSYLMVIHGATGPPRILGSKQKMYTANVGDTVKLKCRATGANDGLAMRTLFYWKKIDSKRVIRSSKDFPRYKIKQGKYLKIKNVQLEDSGRYMCSATNQFGFVSAYRTLTVKDNGKGNVTRTKPKKPTKMPLFTVPMPNIMKGDEGPPHFRNGITNDTKLRQLEHPIGHMARLKCPVVGKPTPTLAWSKNGLPITKSKHVRLGQSNNVLVFKALQKEDSGNYTCIARNKYGSIQIRFSLKVESFARFRDPKAKKTRNVTGIIGKNLTLTCRTDLKGRRGGLPHLHWIKWNSNLRPPKRFPAPRERMATGRNSKFGIGERSKWVYSSNGNGSLIGKLTLINVTAGDKGRYSCMAGIGRRWSTVEEVSVSIVPARPAGNPDASKRGINYNVPILILILVPTAAGIFCVFIAFCCWRFNRKKRRKRFPEDQPLREKPTQNGFADHSVENGRPSNAQRWGTAAEEEKPFLNGISLHTFPSRTKTRSGSDTENALYEETQMSHRGLSSEDTRRNSPKQVTCTTLQSSSSESINNSSSKKRAKSRSDSSSRSPCRTPLKYDHKSPSPRNYCVRTNGVSCSKVNGIKVNGCKCHSSDAVAIVTKTQIPSANAETRTL